MSRYHLRGTVQCRAINVAVFLLLSLQPITSFQPLPPLKYSSAAAAATKNPWRRCAITSTVPSTPPRSNNPLQRLRRPRSPLVAKRLQGKKKFATRSQQATSTLLRVALPTVIATIVGFLYFDNLSLYIRSTLDIGTIRILQADDAQFIQNFLTVIGLLFSILAGNAYSALYQQQESIYFALFQEVSEAKSLLEQTTLVCQGRPFYQSALACIRDYVKNDLRRLDVPPAELLSTRPMEDPLESIMYMTSVGVPSIVYETVKNLRQARGNRLGAMQRKFPFLGIGLLYLLALVELLAFPLLGAGTANIDGVLSLQSFLFACLSGAHMLVLRIIQELWQSSGGVFNVDEVLQQMVFGLEEELELRSQQAPNMNPSAPSIVAQGKYSGMVPLPPYLTGQYQGAPQSAAGSAPLPTTPPPPPPSPPPSSAKAANELSSTRETPWGLESPVAVENNGAAAPSSGEGVEHKAEEADAALPSSDPLLRVQNAASEVRLPRPQRAFFGRVRRAMMEAIQVIGKSQ